MSVIPHRASGVGGPKIESLDRRKMRVLLERRPSGETMSRTPGARLEEVIQDGLRRACELVPAGFGALLLDNPITMRRDRRENELVTLATMTQPGTANPYSVGKTYPVYGNEIGAVYLSGEGNIGMMEMGSERQGYVAVPVYVSVEGGGVLLLGKSLSGRQFSDRDQKMLSVFADYIAGVMSNVLEAERARELSMRDGLTGLMNDRYFHAQLSKEIVLAEEGGEDLALAFLDLDKFKQANDTYGHLAGSMVLKEVGTLIKSICNIPGATLTRYGGDEFVIVLPRANASEGYEICERLRQEIERFVFLRIEGPYGPPLRIANLITASIGIASYHEHVRKRFSIDQNKDAFLKLADRAMYAAKDEGKNCVVMAERESEDESPLTPVSG